MPTTNLPLITPAPDACATNQLRLELAALEPACTTNVERVEVQR